MTKTQKRNKEMTKTQKRNKETPKKTLAKIMTQANKNREAHTVKNNWV